MNPFTEAVSSVLWTDARPPTVGQRRSSLQLGPEAGRARWVGMNLYKNIGFSPHLQVWASVPFAEGDPFFTEQCGYTRDSYRKARVKALVLIGWCSSEHLAKLPLFTCYTLPIHAFGDLRSAFGLRGLADSASMEDAASCNCWSLSTFLW